MPKDTKGMQRGRFNKNFPSHFNGGNHFSYIKNWKPNANHSTAIANITTGQKVVAHSNASNIRKQLIAELQPFFITCNANPYGCEYQNVGFKQLELIRSGDNEADITIAAKLREYPKMKLKCIGPGQKEFCHCMKQVDAITMKFGINGIEARLNKIATEAAEVKKSNMKNNRSIKDAISARHAKEVKDEEIRKYKNMVFLATANIDLLNSDENINRTDDIVIAIKAELNTASERLLNVKDSQAQEQIQLDIFQLNQTLKSAVADHLNQKQRKADLTNDLATAERRTLHLTQEVEESKKRRAHEKRNWRVTQTDLIDFSGNCEAYNKWCKLPMLASIRMKKLITKLRESNENQLDSQNTTTVTKTNAKFETYVLDNSEAEPPKPATLQSVIAKDARECEKNKTKVLELTRYRISAKIKLEFRFFTELVQAIVPFILTEISVMLILVSNNSSKIEPNFQPN